MEGNVERLLRCLAGQCNEEKCKSLTKLATIICTSLPQNLLCLGICSQICLVELVLFECEGGGQRRFPLPPYSFIFHDFEAKFFLILFILKE